jgi:hypothetical protein
MTVPTPIHALEHESTVRLQDTLEFGRPGRRGVGARGSQATPGGAALCAGGFDVDGLPPGLGWAALVGRHPGCTDSRVQKP